MSILARDGRSDLYLCDTNGCGAARPGLKLPIGWVDGLHGYYHLCPTHRGLIDKMDQQVREFGVRSLDGYKGT